MDLILNTDLVISGISGRFPESRNMHEFSENLLSGVDMITNSRWTPGLYGLPKRNGILKNLSKFDNQFFKFSKDEVNDMDPMFRLLMEVTFEAVFDAGINPTSLSGTRTGVFVGAAKSESGEIPTKDPDKVTKYTLFGYSRGMFANGISQAFNFHGPSLTCETACSSSLLAMERAISAIRLKQCDSAIVCGSNLLLKPQASLEFHRLNMLSLEGKCKAFDASGNGYVRSEAVVAIFIQRKSSANKFYAEIIHAKSNVDGYKEEGITFPSGKSQRKLLEEVYAEAQIKPSEVTYVEAHGTGTRVGDPQEVNAIADFFCQNRDPKDPLLIGSVKSNMGHAEHASGLCSIAKVLVAIVRQTIPANIHYENPNTEIPSLTDGRLKVVDKNECWTGGIVGINSFGFGGANVHVILRTPKFSNNAEFESRNSMLINLSGNEEAELRKSLHRIKSLNSFELSLINKITRDNVSGHRYRGIAILNPGFPRQSEINVEKEELTKNEIIETTTHGHDKRPIWFVFSGMGSQWVGMGKGLMNFQPFKKSIDECSDILKRVNLDLSEILLGNDESILEKTTNSFVGIAAIQIAMVDTLNSIGIIPDGFFGHSVGENVCAYVDGISTKEEALLVPFFAGLIFENAKLPAGDMASVGLSWEEVKCLCPNDIFPACNNASDNVSVAGPKESIQNFVKTLKAKGIFAREIGAGQAFHSAHVTSIQSQLIDILKNNGILRKLKKRSNRWISTSIPESKWGFENSGFVSPEYFANNLISPVLFYEGIKFIPENSIVIEIGPHALLHSLLKRALPLTCSLIQLSNKTAEKNEDTFLRGIGKLYLYGRHPIVANLFENPTNVHTSGFLSPYVTWNHFDDFNVPDFEMMDHISNKVKEISLNSNSGANGFKLHGTPYLSPMFVIQMILDAYAENEKVDITSLNVQLENVYFHKQLRFKNIEDIYKISIRFLKESGKFEVLLHGDPARITLVTGQIQPIQQEFKVNMDTISSANPVQLTPEDVYNELSLAGYEFEAGYKMIKSIEMRGNQATLKLDAENTCNMLDAFFQLFILYQPRLEKPVIVSGIGKLIINCGNIKNLDGDISALYLKNQSTLVSSFCKIERIAISTPMEKQVHLRQYISTVGETSSAFGILDNQMKISWVEGPTNVKNFKPQDNVNLELCSVHYSGAQTWPWGKSISNKYGIGNEFSGVTICGQKVMGLVPDFALATQVLVDINFLWEIPEDWTSEDACSVPFAYTIAYYALFVRGEVQPKDTVLVLPCCYSTGIDEAAVRILMTMNCGLYIAVETEEKRNFWIGVFPELKFDNFVPLQNFQYTILQRTNGNGVNLVLNSLTESQLNSALECTSINGKFIHIGSQSHGMNNSTIGMAIFLKNIRFHGIEPESVFLETEYCKKNLHNHFINGLSNCIVKPLTNRKSFTVDEYETAVIHQSKGNKSTIKLSDNIRVHCRPSFNPKETFIIIESTLNLGIEILFYLTKRGAKAIHLILQNTRGSKGLQGFHLQKLKNQGIEITIKIVPTPIRENLREYIHSLLRTRNINGVFFLDNCKEDEFHESKQNQIWILLMTRYFDILTRNSCSLLNNFIVISKTSKQHQSGNAIRKITKERINDGMPSFILNVSNEASSNYRLGKNLTKCIFYNELDQILNRTHLKFYQATLESPFDL